MSLNVEYNGYKTALHTTGKKSKEFSKYFKKNSKRLHIRDDGVFGLRSFSFFSLKLRDDGDAPFLCEELSCVIRSIGLDGHTLRDVDVDG